jgi:hypothetical protein
MVVHKGAGGLVVTAPLHCVRGLSLSDHQLAREGEIRRGSVHQHVHVTSTSYV